MKEINTFQSCFSLGIKSVQVGISVSASFLVQALPSSNLLRMRHIQISVDYRLIFLRIRAQRCRLKSPYMPLLFQPMKRIRIEFQHALHFVGVLNEARVHAPQSGKHLLHAQKENLTSDVYRFPFRLFSPLFQ